MTSSVEQEARAALLAGAEYISENGHCKGTFFEGSGPLTQRALEGQSACALGGVLTATESMNEVFHTARALLVDALYDSYFTGGVGEWNDSPGTSAEDVILTMKRVAHG